ncbi:MAG: peptidyl-tRNA hydrolase [Candidatus Saccharibacteria bacterium]|nr:peptidyl-tRNA hydrolase [Candidatus Saccharibacteria bacterium]
MALFQKKPQTSTSAPLYTVGANKTILIIGLGNPGKEYEGTRHNIGFAALDDFAKRNDFPAWINKKDLKCHLTSLQMGQSRVILAKPTTFVNNSGEAAQAVQHFYRVYNPTTVAIYDELAIKFGQIRTRVGGSDAGHNGVKSLIAHIGDDFGRIRIGVGNEISEKADAADFVLGKFTKAEQEKLPELLKEVGVLMTEYVFGGVLPHETRTIS